MQHKKPLVFTLLINSKLLLALLTYIYMYFHHNIGMFIDLNSSFGNQSSLVSFIGCNL